MNSESVPDTFFVILEQVHGKMWSCTLRRYGTCVCAFAVIQKAFIFMIKRKSTKSFRVRNHKMSVNPRNTRGTTPTSTMNIEIHVDTHVYDEELKLKLKRN